MTAWSRQNGHLAPYPRQTQLYTAFSARTAPGSRPSRMHNVLHDVLFNSLLPDTLYLQFPVVKHAIGSQHPVIFYAPSVGIRHLSCLGGGWPPLTRFRGRLLARDYQIKGDERRHILITFKPRPKGLFSEA